MKATTLESICTRISSGGTPSRKNAEYFTSDETGHLWVKSKELLDCAIDDTEELISDAGLKSSSAKYYPANTVLVAMYGANVGQLGWLRRPATVNQAICGLVVDQNQADWLFIFYALLLNRRDLAAQAQGAAQQNLNQDLIRQFPVDLPPLPIQRRIAGILAAYDKLIENSQRRVKILEEVARRLYSEWFVHFRFPGHEGCRFVASSLGEIPEGWEVKLLKDTCRLTMGQSPKSEFYNETGDGMAFHQGVTDFGDRFPSDRLFCTAKGRNAELGDILFSVRAPVGRMNIANKPMILGRGLSAIRHLEGFQAFLWEQLRSRFAKEDMIGNGAIFASVTRSDMECIELISPPGPLIEAATSHFEPLHSQIATLSQEMQNLRSTRDLLLPRLLSGQIDVEALPEPAPAKP